MSVYSAKLDSLPATVRGVISSDVTSLADALRDGRHHISIAVGSGGSVASAEYVARCRSTLGFAPTLVRTPLELAVEERPLSEMIVWLFTAGGDNPDIVSALSLAIARDVPHVHIVTTTSSSRLLDEARKSVNVSIHVLPVTEAKDGFLATHSVVATTAALLRAADQTATLPIGKALDAAILTSAEERLSAIRRQSMQKWFSAMTADHTLIILADPRLTPAAVTIETSAWETALCPVQRADFRNFAHGRHVWLARRAAQTHVLGLTGSDTFDSWSDIDKVIPPTISRLQMPYGNCGRFQNFLAVLDALVVVEAIGTACGVDPARPGVGEFARAMYEARSLNRLVSRLTPAVRQKQLAGLLRDDPNQCDVDLVEHEARFRARFNDAVFPAVVLDYDGTVVSTEGRYGPPRADVIAELLRLLDGGVVISFATGRGGSAGEWLRQHVPQRYHSSILIGYYNGAYLRPLNVDIVHDPVPTHPAIARATAWLRSRPDLFVAGKIDGVKESGVQVTIQLASLADPSRLRLAFRGAFTADRSVVLSESRHSVDICLRDTCKSAVVRATRDRLADPDAPILCIGDRGGRSGNDFVLLGEPHGVSVDEVCDRPSACWSFFGVEVTGPDALVRILRALVVVPHKGAQLLMSGLALGE